MKLWGLPISLHIRLGYPGYEGAKAQSHRAWRWVPDGAAQPGAGVPGLRHDRSDPGGNGVRAPEARAFVTWTLAHGYEPGLAIDRIDLAAITGGPTADGSLCEDRP